MEPVLVDISKKVSLKEIPVASDKFSIGRGLHNVCIVEDVDVSRTHCIIERNNGEWTILDKSSNGTKLNGQLLDKSRSYKLTPGDIIGLSETAQFVFKMSSNGSNKAVDDSSKKPDLEDLLNIAESVIADVDAFQAEFESEPFDAILNSMDTTNSETNLKSSNMSNVSASGANNAGMTNTNNVSALNADNIKTICTAGSITVQHGSSRAQQNDLDRIDIVQQSQMFHNSQACTSNSTNTSVSSDINSASAPQQLQTLEQQSTGNQKPAIQPNNLEYMEDELQCSICTEMFIQAMTLSCSHTFCKQCITQWQKNQKICPICRAKITMSFPTRVVDSFIEKVLENASDEIKEHRRQLIEQRQATAALASSNAAAAASASSTSAAPNSGSNGRRRPAVDPIEISSGDENSDDDDDLSVDMSDYSGSDWERDYDDDDWFNYNGLPGHYYGGYGQCYACGQRGHWANGCPNKRR